MNITVARTKTRKIMAGVICINCVVCWARCIVRYGIFILLKMSHDNRRQFCATVGKTYVYTVRLFEKSQMAMVAAHVSPAQINHCVNYLFNFVCYTVKAIRTSSPQSISSLNIWDSLSKSNKSNPITVKNITLP